MQTDERLQKLEKEIETIWNILGKHSAWHPSIIEEVRKRSAEARRDHPKGKLRSAKEVFAR